MKAQLKTISLLVGTIPALLIAVFAVIASFVVAVALQIVWFCVATILAMASAIVAGLAIGVMGREMPITERQETFAEWFVCWPLLGELYLLQKFSDLIDLIVQKLEGIDGAVAIIAK